MRTSFIISLNLLPNCFELQRFNLFHWIETLNGILYLHCLLFHSYFNSVQFSVYITGSTCRQTKCVYPMWAYDDKWHRESRSTQDQCLFAWCGIHHYLIQWVIHYDVIKWKHFPRYCPFVRESTGHWGFPSQGPLTRSFHFFLWSATEQTVEQTIETPVIWDAIALIMTSV